MLSVQGRIKPPVIFKKEGLNTQFYCKSHTKPKWIHDDLKERYSSSLHDIYYYRFTDNGRRIHILEVTNLDTGYYECSGTMKNGDRFFARGLLKLIGMCNTVS